MEIKKRFDFRLFWILAYFLSFGIFLAIGFSPAEASEYQIATRLEIPSINLNSDVTTLELVNHELNTPAEIVGSFSKAQNKTLLIGHASSVFGKLDRLKVGDEIIYDQESYLVTDYRVYKKSDVNMNVLLSQEYKKTLVLMTCIGNSLPNNDATHRLVITAEVQ